MILVAAKKKKEVKEKPEGEAAAPEAKPAKRARKKAPAEKVVFTRGKRKEAVARASVCKGTGRVTINSFSVDCINNSYIRNMIYEPIVLAGGAAKELDIDVNVYGGGVMGQAEAARQAIARGIVEFTGNEELKKKMLEYDRHLLAEDSRRVEPKKYKGPKARARFQKSYR